VTLHSANALWGVLCVVGVILLASRASVFGLYHMAAEGAFVLWLARAEWRNRALPSTADPARTHERAAAPRRGLRACPASARSRED
jgi:threonine/homoserine/homoserine lactone efflux protein